MKIVEMTKIESNK